MAENDFWYISVHIVVFFYVKAQKQCTRTVMEIKQRGFLLNIVNETFN